VVLFSNLVWLYGWPLSFVWVFLGFFLKKAILFLSECHNKEVEQLCLHLKHRLPGTDQTDLGAVMSSFVVLPFFSQSKMPLRFFLHFGKGHLTF